MPEQTLIILKPDALGKKAEFKILDRLQNSGLNVVSMYKTHATRETMRQHYAELYVKKGEQIGDSTLEFMISGPIIIALIEGENAVERVRNLGGRETEPIKCPEGTIRGDFSADSYEKANAENRSVHNLIHSSDSPESAKREIKIWFNEYPHNLEKPENQIYQQIAGIINYPCQDLVKNIIEVSKSKKAMFHGIKYPKNIEKILLLGILPLTPSLSCGKCSFWSTGTNLFLPMEDSPFFNYSSRHLNPRVTEMNLALSFYDLLVEKNIKLNEYEPDSQLSLAQQVPLDCFSIINVSVEHPPSEEHQELRKYAQKAEQIALFSLASNLYSFSPGKIIKHLDKIR